MTEVREALAIDVLVNKQEFPRRGRTGEHFRAHAQASCGQGPVSAVLIDVPPAPTAVPTM